MKANYQMQAIPANGVQVTVEGGLVRILFNFSKVKPSKDKDAEHPTADDLYDCESIDVPGRSKGAIISAIVADRYSTDSTLAILANFAKAQDKDSELPDAKRAEYIAEYAAYQDWRSRAKEVASIVIDIITEA